MKRIVCICVLMLLFNASIIVAQGYRNPAMARIQSYGVYYVQSQPQVQAGFFYGPPLPRGYIRPRVLIYPYPRLYAPRRWGARSWRWGC
ncbi:MAG: hypothetical protein RML40_06540 [Bacteroidota bacterium]|nr:hypothetical protein [Candidatus Kapabacteria bacterium]MDW8220174.1 hypothetical protein [Bacteroidota bacterium]